MTPIVPSSKPRREYRAPVGMPKGREDWRIGTVVSALVHLGLLFALITPFAAGANLILQEQGAGGAGPAGGGGGGKRGTGGVQAELLRYISVAPPPPAPVVPKMEIPPPPKPEPQPQQPEAPLTDIKPAEVAPTPGAGGGTGADSAGGSGPGSGGGVGSGVGTGRGSGVGPGTGGGTQANYAPTPIEMFIPPMPVPRSARGFRVVAQFDVDESGKVRGMEFTPTPDRGYNQRLRDVLQNYKFRPGTRQDGTPIRMKAQVEIELP